MTIEKLNHRRLLVHVHANTFLKPEEVAKEVSPFSY